MRLHSLHLRGIGPSYPDEIRLDLDAIDGDLIAITGANGAGKSTLVECFAAALHPSRKMPTRGSIDSLADEHGEGSFVDVSFTYQGKIHRIRHEPNRSQSHVWIDGEPVPLDGGKVSRFTEWSKLHLPAPEIVTSAFVLTQRSEGAIDADGAERRAILLRSIGIAEIEALAEKARGLKRDAERARDDLHAEIGRHRTRAGDVAAIEARHASLSASLTAAQEARVAADERLRQARADLDAYQVRERERAAATAQRCAMEGRIEDAARRLHDLDERIAAERATLHDAAGIRERASRARAIEVLLVEHRAAAALHRAEATRAGDRAAVEEAAAEAERSRWKAADGRRKAAEGRLVDRAMVESAVASLPALRAAVEEAETALARASAEAEAIHQAAARGTAGRIVALRTGLDDVLQADHLERAHDIASEALAGDDRAVNAVSGTLPAADAAVASARPLLDAARSSLAAAEKLAARAPDIAAAVQLLDEAIADRSAAEEAGKAARARGQARRDEETAATTRAHHVDAAIADLEGEAVSLSADVEREPTLAGAEARLAEIEAQRSSVATEHAALVADISALPSLPDPLPCPDVDAADRALREASATIARLTGEVAVAGRDLDAARVAAAYLAAAEARLPALETRVADAVLLAEALGVTGVQALEIDAAGPALTANMNELLHGAYGARFTAEVVTTKKRRTSEETEILVLDTEKGGGKRDVRTFSGGERVPLATAFFLALAVYLCRSRGIEAPTLILDEPGSGLDDGHMEQWLSMLRSAAKMAGASKTVVVSHDPRVIEAADAVVKIEGGRISRVR